MLSRSTMFVLKPLQMCPLTFLTILSYPSLNSFQTFQFAHLSTDLKFSQAKFSRIFLKIINVCRFAQCVSGSSIFISPLFASFLRTVKSFDRIATMWKKRES